MNELIFLLTPEVVLEEADLEAAASVEAVAEAEAPAEDFER